MSVNGKRKAPTGVPGIWHAIAFLIVAIILNVVSFFLLGFLGGYFVFLLFGSLFVIFFAREKRRLSLFIYFFLAVGLLVGWLFSTPQAGKEFAARARDWLILGPQIKSTAARVAVFIVAGLVGGSLFVVLPLCAVVLLSAEWMLALRKTYGVSRKLAFQLLFNLALGIGEAIAIADEGEIKERKPDGPLEKFGAPVAVVVKPYNAVMLVRGGNVSRIEGPGLVKLQKEEEVECVVDLRPQSGPYEVEVRTKDNIPLTVKGGLSFRIQSRDEAQELRDKGGAETSRLSGVIGGAYPVYRHTLHQAVYAVGAGKKWIEKTTGAPNGKVRTAMRNYYLEDIFPLNGAGRDESIVDNLAKEVAEKVKKSAREWGVTVYGVGVNEIEMHEDVDAHFFDRWKAGWERQIKTIQADGQARAIESVARAESVAIHALEQAKSRAIEDFARQVLNGIQMPGLMQNPQIAARFIAALEGLARNIVADDRVAARFTEGLEQHLPNPPTGRAE